MERGDSKVEGSRPRRMLLAKRSPSPFLKWGAGWSGAGVRGGAVPLASSFGWRVVERAFDQAEEIAGEFSVGDDPRGAGGARGLLRCHVIMRAIGQHGHLRCSGGGDSLFPGDAGDTIMHDDDGW